MSSTIKSKQRLFFERVQAHYPGADVAVKCELATYGVNWSVYCSRFPAHVCEYSWSTTFDTLAKLEAWFDDAHPLQAEPEDLDNTITSEESPDGPVLPADKTADAAGEKGYPL